MARIMHRMRCHPPTPAPRSVLPALLCCAMLAGCSPAQDWRELRPEGSGATLMFPCKPTHHARDLPLAGAALRLTLHACTAGDDVTWALAVADVVDPARIAATLRALRDSAASNIGAGAPTPAAAGRARRDAERAIQRAAAYTGQRPTVKPVQMQVAVFTKGTRVYQATVLGRRIGAEAAETFFSALHTP